MLVTVETFFKGPVVTMVNGVTVVRSHKALRASCGSQLRFELDVCSNLIRYYEMKLISSWRSSDLAKKRRTRGCGKGC